MAQKVENTTKVKLVYYYVGLSFLALFASFWLLSNLGNCMLWQDEAETACVAQTVLSEGIPKGTDGINFFSQQEGREYGYHYEWKLHPWFQFYWLALFFSILETSTLSARLPFTLLGLATVFISFFLSLRLWADKKTAYFVALAFLSNIMFLLLVRQARYYAPVMFFSVYATWGFLDILDKKRIGYLHYILASFLFFQSQYLFAINWWIACLVYTWLFYKPRFKAISIATAVVALPSLPFLWWILDTPYGKTLVDGSTQEGFSYGLKRYTGTFFTQVFEPLWLMILVLFYFLSDHTKGFFKQFESSPVLLFFCLIMVGNILALSLTVPEYYLRYLCATIPFALLLKGRLAGWMARRHWAIPLSIFIALIVYKGAIQKYVTELTANAYVGPIESIVNFMNREANDDDSIAIFFGDLPLKFYLNNRIYGGLAGDLPTNLDSINFIIVRRNAVDVMDSKVQLRLHEYLQKNQQKFKAFALNVEDSPFQNREIPEAHFYEPPLVSNALVIHQRIN
jgi:hypothetical protein